MGRGRPARSGPVRDKVLLQCSIVSNVESGPKSENCKRANVDRANPEIARETAISKVQKLEQALHLMSDCPGPAADVVKQELEKARAASKKPLIDVEVEQCRNFIGRVEKRVAELDAERAAEVKALTEAQDRLQRWRQNRPL